mmetsp:Transcript_2345/g.5719  ORF Transcript_2345/g.5719 Transcript_2345/m.5719 type:complete len:238 (-) Transcript_2345:308-1021(-)
MKLLINPVLAGLSEEISGFHAEVRVDCRIESYSCKMAGHDKKLFKQLLSFGADADGTEALSPAHMSPSVLPGSAPVSFEGGSPDFRVHSCSTRTLFYLKATLNAVFHPDYDFTHAKATEFAKEPSMAWIKRNIDAHLSPVFGPGFHSLNATLWGALDAEIAPGDCDIYSYIPNLDTDPFGEEGMLWSFNYFLYNKKLKRIVFFRTTAFSHSAPSSDDDTEDEGAAAAMSEDEFDYLE